MSTNQKFCTTHVSDVIDMCLGGTRRDLARYPRSMTILYKFKVTDQVRKLEVESVVNR